MSNLQLRSNEPEWMDTCCVTPDDFAACLVDLASVNTVTLARLPTLGFMRRLVRRHPGRRLTILDVGCGEGDMLRRLHRWARRGGHKLELTGLDVNELGIRAAQAATPSDTGIRYLKADIFDPGLGEYDVILSSLFTHHLTDRQISQFLQVMECHARVGWFVNDLQRNRIAYEAFRALSTVAAWHRFVRHDGPISVARGFHRTEWRRLLRRASLDHTTELRWHVPFRLCVARFK